MKIYTKTGDMGETGLIGGSRISKSSLRIQAIGAVDTANGAFGNVFDLPEDLAIEVRRIQARLFEVGAELAGLPDGRLNFEFIEAHHISELETSIDEMDGRLPTLSTFILPGGSRPSAALHVARSAVRSAERSVIELSNSSQDAVRPDLIVFLNRLSDWAFTAARFVNLVLEVEEVPWTREDSK